VSFILQILLQWPYRGFFFFVLLWGSEDLHTEFYLGRLKERNQLEDLDIDGTTSLNEVINMKGWRGPAYDMDMCWAVVNMVMNIRGPME